MLRDHCNSTYHHGQIVPACEVEEEQALNQRCEESVGLDEVKSTQKEMYLFYDHFVRRQVFADPVLVLSPVSDTHKDHRGQHNQ